jgi:hypothetical protein
LSIKLVWNQTPAALASLGVLAFFTWRIQTLTLGKAPMALCGSYLQLFEILGDFYKARYSREGISKPIFGVILNEPRELKLGKNTPPFLKGGR